MCEVAFTTPSPNTSLGAAPGVLSSDWVKPERLFLWSGESCLGCAAPAPMTPRARGLKDAEVGLCRSDVSHRRAQLVRERRGKQKLAAGGQGLWHFERGHVVLLCRIGGNGAGNKAASPAEERSQKVSAKANVVAVQKVRGQHADIRQLAATYGGRHPHAVASKPEFPIRLLEPDHVGAA